MMSLDLHKKRERQEKQRQQDAKLAATRKERRQKHAAKTASTLHKRPERFKANEVSIRISQREKQTPVPTRRRATRPDRSHVACLCPIMASHTR